MFRRSFVLLTYVCCITVYTGSQAADTTDQGPPLVVPTIIAPPNLASIHCNGTRADIVFVLDMSSSVGQQNFIIMKDFVKSIVKVLSIGQERTRVGVITFSTFPHHEIYLDDHTSEKNLLSAIDKIPYHNGVTVTDNALNLLEREGYRGINRYVPKIGIVVTDGRSLHPTETAKAAQQAKARGITLFTVGIGSQITTEELNKIASSPTPEHVFLVSEFTKLVSIVSAVAEGTCNVRAPNNTATTQTPTPPSSQTTVVPTYIRNGSLIYDNCNRSVADIMFVLDSSGSLGQYHFRQLKSFVIDIARALDISPNLTQVGVITFNNYPLLRIPIDRYHNKTDLLNAINAIPYYPGNTDTDKALDFLRLGGFTGGRANVPNVAIVITDGKSYDNTLTVKAATELKKTGTTVFAIGIGDEIDTVELDAISSDPNSFFRFFVGNFTSLGNILATVVNNTCIVPVQLKRTTKASTLPTTSTTTTTSSTTSPTTATTAPTTTTTTPTTTKTTPKPPTTTPTTTSTPTTATTSTAPTTMSTAAPTTQNSVCVNKLADIMFVVDSSGSIGLDNFLKVKNFVKQTITFFDVGTNFTRVGMITFNQHAILQFGLDKFSSSNDLQRAVDGIVYTAGGTNTGRALEMLRMRGFTNERQKAPNIAIVITDGRSADPVATKQQAALIKQQGDTTIIAIGIGNGTDYRELSNIASVKGSNTSLVYQVGDYDALQTLNSIVAYVACGAAPPPVNLTRFTPAPTPQPPTQTSKCSDLIDDCSNYGKAACSDYRPWAIAHCSAYCGFCKSPVSTTPRPCVNTITNCHEYGTYICTSVSLTKWTKEHCPLYCGFCGNGTRPTGAPASPAPVTTPAAVPQKCTNLIGNCDEYGGKGMCQQETYKSWAKEHCQEYCGYCTNSKIVTSKPLPNVKCPTWKLPVECTLVYYDNGCCPIPQCPSGYILAAEAPHL